MSPRLATIVGLILCAGTIWFLIMSKNVEREERTEGKENLFSSPSSRKREKIGERAISGSSAPESNKRNSMSFNQIVSRIKETTDPVLRNRLIKEMVSAYGPSPDLRPDVERFLLSLPENEARQHLVSLSRQDPSANPAFFKATLDKLGAGRDRQALLRRGVQMLPYEDLIKLIEHISGSGYPEDLTAVAEGIERGGLSEDVDESILGGSNKKILSTEILRALARTLGTRKALNDSGSVSDFSSITAGIPEGIRDEYATAYYTNALRLNLDAQMSKFEATGAPAPVVDNIMNNLARYRFGSKGGHQASLDAREFTTDSAKSKYLHSVAKIWLNSDSIEATKAIGSMPDGNGRDYMISALVDYCWANGDSAGAQQWAAEIKNTDLRSKHKIDK